jgi:hypothetical protein
MALDGVGFCDIFHERKLKVSFGMPSLRIVTDYMEWFVVGGFRCLCSPWGIGRNAGSTSVCPCSRCN